MELNFDELKREIEIRFKNIRVMVLSTSDNDKVTSRSMSVVNDGLDIYFQTDKTFEKYNQMKKNKNVALCVDNIQIEGRASELGHPLDKGNVLFLNKYKEHHKSSFENYSHLKNEVLFKIEPIKITLWKYLDKKPCRDILFYKEKVARREFYDI